jgi:3-oxo-5alpha-steroid 4-dehydrogenase
MSGGVVYAGGGTHEQHEAGVADDPDEMFRYLRLETGGVVSDDTLRRFCRESASMIGWLKGLDVRFDSHAAPYPTSYPTKEHYLYEAGNERSGPARAVAAPAARGHRVRGKGTSGAVLFGALQDAARRRGVRVQAGTRATRLVTDEQDRVVGVECTTIHKAPGRVRREHRALAERLGRASTWHRSVDRKVSDRLEQIERRFGRTWRVRATRGVVLAAGGFQANPVLVEQHAPRYAFGLPLGTLGDDGSGLGLGEEAGGATRHLERFSAWRFFTPPAALAKGVLLAPSGERICNEALFGATIAEHVLHEHGGRAYLLLDAVAAEEARGQVASQTRWFQRVQAQSMLGSGSVTGATVAEVAAKAGIDVAVAQASVAAYNVVAGTGGADPLGKAPDLVRAVEQGPFLLADVSVRSSKQFPCPVMSLGGLVVDENTGQVLREDGSTVHGLYAAGRTAVGICSTSYIGGLALADCVFSGRRAGRTAGALGAEVVDAVR